MARVSLQHIAKTFPGGHAAVRDVSLEIADGEFLVLVGPSGCGKSTTLRLVAGLEEATTGMIMIGDRVVNEVHPKDRDIAMVFQNYALYPHMSVYKNMAFALKLRRVARAEIERRVMGTARMLGIEELLDRKPRALSGGQRQRVAVGRAIVREPKAFLFDEPLSNLDAKLRVTTRAELKALHQRLKTTTIYVTHDQEEAMTLGDRIAVMHKGQLQQVAPPLEVYRRPTNRFVASFVGTPPMNFIDGTITAEGDATLFVEKPGSVGGGGGPQARVRLTRAIADGLLPMAGRAIVMGVRPQHLREADAASGEDSTLGVQVGVVEPLGDSMDLHGATAAGNAIVARVPARVGLSGGQFVRLAVDVGQANFFAPGEEGKNLLLG